MLNYQITKDRIEFLDNRFYHSNGKFLPSVTTILEAYPKDAGYFKWLKEVGSDADSIRDEAGRRGSIVHELTERYDSGEECSIVNQYGNPQFKMSEWAMFERYVEFSTRFQPKIDMIEAHLLSEDLGYAGTIDRVIELDDKLILMDIKTSNAIYPSYWLQLAAYANLLGEQGIKIDKVSILWLNAKTRSEGKKGDIQGPGWQLVSKYAEESFIDDLPLFKIVHQLWLHQNADIKPRQISYQLKHKK